MTTKIKLTTALAVLCAGLSLFAAETQFTQNGILINNGSWVDIGNLSNGTPNADTDFLLSGVYTTVLGNSILEVNNLNFDSGSIFTVSNGGSGTNNDRAQIKDGSFDMSAYIGPSLIVRGNINIDGKDSNNTYIGSGDYRAGFEQIKVGSNININGGSTVQFGFNPNAAYGEGHYGLDVAGVVNMNNPSVRLIINRFGGGDSKKYSDITMSAFVRMGGLNGSGAICNNDPGALSTTIIFQAQDGKTFTGGDWSGQVRADWVLTGHGGSAESSETKFIMNDTSGGGKQTLRIESASNSSNNYANVTDLNFEIRNGTLGLFMTAGNVRAKNISVSGGMLEIAEASRDTAELGNGAIYTDNLEITGGEILFTLSKEGDYIFCDHIEAENISGANGTFIIELDENVFSAGDVIKLNDIILFSRQKLRLEQFHPESGVRRRRHNKIFG